MFSLHIFVPLSMFHKLPMDRTIVRAWKDIFITAVILAFKLSDSCCGQVCSKNQSQFKANIQRWRLHKHLGSGPRHTLFSIQMVRWTAASLLHTHVKFKSLWLHFPSLAAQRQSSVSHFLSNWLPWSKPCVAHDTHNHVSTLSCSSSHLLSCCYEHNIPWQRHGPRAEDSKSSEQCS